MQISNPPLAPKILSTVATTQALPSNTYVNGASGIGASITADSVGVWTVDGYNINAGDYVLVKDEATPVNNGLYLVVNAGSPTSKTVLVRSEQMDAAADFSGVLIPLGSLGTTLANTIWICNATGTIVVGTTDLPYAEITSSGINPTGVYGDGSDGPITVTGTVTLTRNIYATAYTVALGGTVYTNGYAIFATEQITVDDGAFIYDIASFTKDGAAAAATSATSWAPPTAYANGGAGGSQAQVADGVPSAFGGSGGNGGNGGDGFPGAGGVATPPTPDAGTIRSAPFALIGYGFGSGGTTTVMGPGAGGGAGDTDAGATLLGGGGGAGGGYMVLAAPVIIVNGLISVQGGYGGAGDSAGNTGGGGGGGGGVLVTLGAYRGFAPDISGGGGGEGGGTGTVGAAGADGTWIKLIV